MSGGANCPLVPAQTDAEILDELLAARRKLVTRGAASYSVNGRTFTALDIDKLNELVAQYEQRIASATSSMLSGRGRFAS